MCTLTIMWERKCWRQQLLTWTYSGEWVAACGVISEYADATKRAAPNMIDIAYKRIKIQEFSYSRIISICIKISFRWLVMPFVPAKFSHFSIPSAFIGLFRCDNIGKKLVRIADEWTVQENKEEYVTFSVSFYEVTNINIWHFVRSCV